MTSGARTRPADDAHIRRLRVNDDRTPTAVVVGAGFAGIGAARELAKHGVRVVLVERHD